MHSFKVLLALLTSWTKVNVVVLSRTKWSEGSRGFPSSRKVPRSPRQPQDDRFSRCQGVSTKPMPFWKNIKRAASALFPAFRLAAMMLLLLGVSAQTSRSASAKTRPPQQSAQSASPAAASSTAKPVTILSPEDVTRIIPASVFFRGQSATVQMRNTLGLRLPNDVLVLFGLVDSSGYSSGLRLKYQGYLLTEVPLKISGKKLPPGAYGFGFIDGNIFVVMDIGGHDVLRVPWRSDETLHRPRPILLVAGDRAGDYKLYEGRRFITFHVNPAP